VIIFGTVAGLAAGAIAGACAFVALISFWVLLPVWVRSEAPPAQ
jgi:hypothetical protein